MGDSLYYNLGVASGIPGTPVTVHAGVGYSDGSLALTAPAGDYLDWSLGASYVIGPATLSARYIDTDIAKTGVKARSEEHTSELQSLMRISYAVLCLKKKQEENKCYR